MKELVGQGKPFYSALDQAAQALKRNVGTGQEFMKELVAQPGVKQQEIQDRMLAELISKGKMSRNEFVSHLKSKPAPAIHEKILGGAQEYDKKRLAKLEAEFKQLKQHPIDDPSFGEEKYGELIKLMNIRDQSTVENLYEAAERAMKSAQRAQQQGHKLTAEKYWRENELLNDRAERLDLRGQGQENPPRHEKFTLPGGENYREMLIKSPKEAEQFPGVYSHFGGEPGILASMRLKDRKGPNGEKLLHLEELQSDWHQQGREKGYASKDAEKQLKESIERMDLRGLQIRQLSDRMAALNDNQLDEFNALAEQRQRLQDLQTQEMDWGNKVYDAQRSGVPDAPFKKNWEEMALKRLLHHAAEKGYHGIVVTPGQEQADRYGLATHIDEISHFPTHNTITNNKFKTVKIDTKNGQSIHLAVTPEGVVKGVSNLEYDQFLNKNLNDILGKDISKNILQNERGVIPTKDLTVGGEGMKGFYDKKVPNILNNIGKKYGVKTQLHAHPIETGREEMVPDNAGLGQIRSGKPAYAQTHYFPITEDMRKDILSNGLPLYAEGGIIHKAVGGTMDTPTLAQMRVNLAQHRNPDLMDSIGVNEALDMNPKMFVNPAPKAIGGIPSIGGVSTKNGLPIGGVDINPQQPGQQLNPQPAPMPGQPQPGAPGGAPSPGGAAVGPTGGMLAQSGNLLQLTPQGQAMAAMGGGTTQQPQQLANGGMANGGQKPKKLTVEEMKRAIFEKAQKGLQKASEVLGKHEGSNIFLTEADRAKVEKKKNGMRGGVGFSQIGLENPDYAGRTWGVGNSGTAIKLLNRQNKGAPEGNAIWTTFIGTPEMHTSNQIVFDRMYKNFLQAKKAGLLSPEKEAEMLDIMRSAMTKGTEKKPSQAIFKPNANFDDNDLFNTFEKRRILSDLMSGKKIGGKKAQIFDASKMIEDTTDPKLLHAPTLSVGPHVFTFNGETSYEPHLNQAFPFMLHGETSPDAFQQVPFETFAEDFINQIKQTKGRDPGYMDIVRNIPSQFLSEKYLTNLQKQGYEEGGNVKLHEDIEMASGGAMRLELLKKKARDAFPHMNDGGQPPKRRVFNIMPATQGAVKSHSRFSDYDASNPTIASLARAFDEAIAHHLALPHNERKMNSVRASEMVSNHVGRTSEGKPKDLLGKNAKLIKSEKGGEEAIKLDDGRGVETTGLALAPAFMQGHFHTCPNSASCKEECLGKTSGNYFKLGGGTNLEEFKGPRLNSLNKTLAMINDPHSFAVKLYDEIQDAKAAAAQNNNHLGVRLNVLSDINPRVHKSIINGHPDVTFYDYTKNNTNPIAPNHHYTYSSTGVSDQDVHNPNSNWKQMRRRLENGDNVAMAFTHNEHLPHQIVDEETGKVFKVINGDSHDFRPLDMVPEGEYGVIVGLKNKKATGEKQNAHIDSNGFFVKYDPQLLKRDDGKYARLPSDRISPKTGKPMLGETMPQNRTVRIEPQGDAPRAKSNDEGWHV